MPSFNEQVTVQVRYPNEVHFAVEQAVRPHHLYRLGTNPERYVRMSRERADLLIAHLNQIEGVKARVYGE